MTEFIKAVQSDKLAGPFRRDFKETTWKKRFDELGTDSVDANLYDVGLLMHLKAKELRSMLKVTFSTELNATSKIRAFIAVANSNFCSINIKTREAFKEATKTGEVVMLHELAAVKLQLPIGESFKPDEIVQSVVDGIQLPLKVLLSENPSLKGNPHYASVNWGHIIEEFNLGIIYSHIEDLWDDCLWNGYQAKQMEHHIRFTPLDPVWQYRLTASRAREGNIQLQFYNTGEIIVRRSQALQKRIGLHDVKNITKVGRTQIIKLTHQALASRRAIQIHTARSYAAEPYYAEMLDEPHELLGHSTLNDLLSAWGILSQVSSQFMAPLIEPDTVVHEKPNSPNNYFPEYVPALQKNALIQAIIDALGVNRLKASSLIEFLIFRGRSGQELWTQPLVPISNENVSPVFAALSSPNLARIIDIWIKQLGIDMAQRGPAFEKYVNAEIQEDIESSKLLKEAKVLRDGITFRPQTDREEQIDTVIVIGNTVLIGESKCITHPAEAKQYAMHRKTITDATAQVLRKASSVEGNRPAFQKQMHGLGIDLQAGFTIQPIVIINSPVHAGFAVDGVPVVDLLILSVFFRGEIVDVAIQEPNGDLTTKTKRVFYSDLADAADKVTAFLMSPSQMESFISGTTERFVPVMRLSEKDWAGEYLTFECTPKINEDAKA